MCVECVTFGAMVLGFVRHFWRSHIVPGYQACKTVLFSR